MAIAFITTPPDPNALTPLAEFQSQTPESLTDSEVLHYSSPVEVTFTPASASPFQSSSAKIYVTSKYYSSSTITNGRIVTLWSETDSKGLAIPFPNISLHAAQAPGSRGENSRGCIYMQLEDTSHLMSGSATNGNSRESPENEDDEMAELVEVNLIPADESTCKSKFPISINV
jgi:Regulator of volume decrease after cellular swelling